MTVGAGDTRLVLPWPVVLWATAVIFALGGLIVQLQFTIQSQDKLAQQIEMHISGKSGDVMTERVTKLNNEVAELRGKVEILQQTVAGKGR